MTRQPSQAVIEAVERAQTLHGRTLSGVAADLRAALATTGEGQ